MKYSRQVYVLQFSRQLRCSPCPSRVVSLAAEGIMAQAVEHTHLKRCRSDITTRERETLFCFSRLLFAQPRVWVIELLITLCSLRLLRWLLFAPASKKIICRRWRWKRRRRPGSPGSPIIVFIIIIPLCVHMHRHVGYGCAAHLCTFSPPSERVRTLGALRN